MHEIGICEAILEKVEQRADGRPVSAIGVRAGALHRIVPDAFAQAFELVTAGGIAHGAEAELVVTPVTGRCADCGHADEADDPLAVCGSCGSARMTPTGGDELVLEWIRYRDDQPAGGSDPGGGA